MYKDPLEDMFGDEHDLEGLSQLLLFHMLSGTSLTFIMFNKMVLKLYWCQFSYQNYIIFQIQLETLVHCLLIMLKLHCVI